jgi:hypothetical protein
VNGDAEPYVCLVLDTTVTEEGMQARSTFPCCGTSLVNVWILNVPEDKPLEAFRVILSYYRADMRLDAPEPKSKFSRLVRDGDWVCADPSPTAELRRGHEFADDVASTQEADIGCRRSPRSAKPPLSGDIWLASFEMTPGNIMSAATVGLRGSASSGNEMLVDCSIVEHCLGAEFHILEPNY